MTITASQTFGGYFAMAGGAYTINVQIRRPGVPTIWRSLRAHPRHCGFAFFATPNLRELACSIDLSEGHAAAKDPQGAAADFGAQAAASGEQECRRGHGDRKGAWSGSLRSATR
jgi:hypothetical protein